MFRNSMSDPRELLPSELRQLIMQFNQRPEKDDKWRAQ